MKRKTAKKAIVSDRFLKELVELAYATQSGIPLLEHGLNGAISGKLTTMNSMALAKERGFRARLVIEVAFLHQRYGLDGSPPPRSSIDRWLDGQLIPEVRKYLIIAMAFERLNQKAKS